MCHIAKQQNHKPKNHRNYFLLTIPPEASPEENLPWGVQRICFTLTAKLLVFSFLYDVFVII